MSSINTFVLRNSWSGAILNDELDDIETQKIPIVFGFRK